MHRIARSTFSCRRTKKYAKNDILLGPFLFTGGLTSYVVLWMGGQVVTWPQSRVVRCQTFALLSAIGHTEWVAQEAQSYVNIAQSLCLKI